MQRVVTFNLEPICIYLLLLISISMRRNSVNYVTKSSLVSKFTIFDVEGCETARPYLINAIFL